MDKKTKCWILSCLSETYKKKGIEVTQLFDQRPDSLPDDLPRFFKLLLDLESEGLIEFNKEMSKPYFRITAKGKKELEDYVKCAKIKDVFKYGSNTR